MKLLDSLTIALLSAGILSSSIAQGRIVRGPKFPLSERDATSRSVDFFIEILDPANYVNFSQEQCEENGGSDAYDELEASLEQFQVNVQTLVEPLRHETEIALVHPRNRLPLVVKKYCRKVPTLQKYIKRVTDSIHACLDRAGVQRVIGDRFFANAFLEYICQDEGRGLAKFITDGGMECLASKKEELLNCANESFGRYLSGGEFVGDGVSEVKGFEMLFALDSKRCVDVREFQSCISGVLNDCQEPTTETVLNDLIDDLIIRMTSCETSTRISEVEEHVSPIAHEISSEDEDFRSFMRQKCEKSGGGTSAFESIGESFQVVSRVLKVLGLDRLQHDIEYAAFESNSDFDSALAMHCRKVPIVIGIEKFATDTFKSCLEPDELGMDVFHNVTSSLLEAACYNEGNAIAAFVAGDGVQCMEYKRKELNSCVFEIYGKYFVEAGGWKRRATPETPFVIDLKDCEDMERLRNCSVPLLAECEDNTASYMLDSVFDIIHDEMSCEELREAKLRDEWSEAEILADMFREYLEGNCEKHGGPTAYEAVKEIPEYVGSALALVTMNIQQLHYDVTEGLLDGQVDIVFKKYCRKIPAFQKFINHAAESVAPCFDQGDVDFQSHLLISFLDTMCENEGERLTKLITSGGLKCIESKQPAIHQCIPLKYKGEFEGLVKLREDLDAEDCTAINQTQQCFIDVLNECEVPVAVQIAIDLNNTLMKYSTCGSQVAVTD